MHCRFVRVFFANKQLQMAMKGVVRHVFLNPTLSNRSRKRVQILKERSAG